MIWSTVWLVLVKFRNLSVLQNFKYPTIQLFLRHIWNVLEPPDLSLPYFNYTTLRQYISKHSQHSTLWLVHSYVNKKPLQQLFVFFNSILQRKSFFSRSYFKQCKLFILKCLYRINLLRAFKFTQGRFPPSFFFTSRILLRNWPGNWCSTLFMAPLSSIFVIFWSINNSCVLDVSTSFGIVLCTEIFKNDITYPFTTNKISWSWVNFCQFLLKWANLPANCKFGIFPVNQVFTTGWTFVRDSSGINSGNFLDKGARFWSRTLLTWDTTVPFVVFFLTILCAMSVSIVRFFTVVKSPSTIRFIVVRWMICPKGLFGRMRSATTSTRGNLQSCFLLHVVLLQRHAIWTFCQKDFDRLFEVSLPFPSK